MQFVNIESDLYWTIFNINKEADFGLLSGNCKKINRPQSDAKLSGVVGILTNQERLSSYNHTLISINYCNYGAGQC